MAVRSARHPNAMTHAQFTTPDVSIPYDMSPGPVTPGCLHGSETAASAASFVFTVAIRPAFPSVHPGGCQRESHASRRGPVQFHALRIFAAALRNR